MSLKSLKKAAEKSKKAEAHLLYYQKQAMSIGVSEQLKMAVLAFIMCLLTIPVILTNSLTFSSYIAAAVCFAILVFFIS